jgi:hypothetical protein
MKITVKTTIGDNWGFKQEENLLTLLETQEGRIEASFGHGEPEDMFLYRDLNDAYSIRKMLEMAYNAGKAGEILEIEEITERDE